MRRDPRCPPLPAKPPARQDIICAYPNGTNATPRGQRSLPLPAEVPARQDIMWAGPNGPAHLDVILNPEAERAWHARADEVDDTVPLARPRFTLRAIKLVRSTI